MGLSTLTAITEPVVLDRTMQNIGETMKDIRNILSDGTPKRIIYGFRINSSESDPEDAVTYLQDAVGMTPAHMDYTNDSFNYGSWADAFFMPKPCMLKYDGTVDYYLDVNDYGYKEGSLDASDVANDAYPGNAMMEWGRDGQKIWYKIVPDSDPTCANVFIANYRVDKDYNAWSFINSRGDYVDHFYTPIYNGWYDGTRIRSISGKIPTVSLSAAVERERCRANGSEIWDTEVFSDTILVNLLLVLIGKSLDSQTVFGQGCTTPGQSGVLNTGTGDNKGLFYGSSNTVSVVKVFGMENWWGNLWRRFGGCVNDKGTLRYKLTRGAQDGSTASDYVISNSSADYAGYLTGGSVPVSGYVNKMLFNGSIYQNYSSSGSVSTFYCDYFYSNNGQVDYAFRGGYTGSGSACGAWSLNLNYAASDAYWNVAAAPSCKPLS